MTYEGDEEDTCSIENDEYGTTVKKAAADDFAVTYPLCGHYGNLVLSFVNLNEPALNKAFQYQARVLLSRVTECVQGDLGT